ncbi:hypothetical protein DPMN_029228 [Dreissena polymorpha]|uniref:Uncharacterized protein n=1 Tax=Dreissena polymorpha TaxID=45954 RepID=A0A9D4M0E5_DREPO|nr:hypothetical protein DPMN_029228 [Dreissena polymorpha]
MALTLTGNTLVLNIEAENLKRSNVLSNYSRPCVRHSKAIRKCRKVETDSFLRVQLESPRSSLRQPTT